MKNLFWRTILSLACFLSMPNLLSEQLITFFLRPYPIAEPEQKIKKLTHKMGYPGKLAKQHAKHLLWAKDMVSGVFATYGGFLTVSSLNGQISFPRKHSQPSIKLVISERISPIVRSGNTLSHWELNPDRQAAIYTITKTKNAQTSLEYFTVEQMPLPENSVVPIDSIVLFAQPKYFYIPTGMTLSPESLHLIMPDVYVKKGLTINENALYVLSVMQYFGILTQMTRKEPRRMTTHLLY